MRARRQVEKNRNEKADGGRQKSKVKREGRRFARESKEEGNSGLQLLSKELDSGD